jgi:hypothetical protein
LVRQGVDSSISVWKPERAVGARKRIVHVATLHRLAGLAIVDEVLAQGLADALDRAAVELAAYRSSG